ncbi:glycosyltransferase [Sphingosinithalassobacter portus]|uniref:glycosyltransferase n=1 Tax=Stakelama portus TaxID=2676234 RepID=UPI000D6DCDCC|nr:glycosyltransferase [Sphingosinithalassobacter portus]
MRIVDVNEYYSPTGGGVRTYLDRKMGILAELGHELIVIAPGRENSIEDRPGGGRIHWVKAPRLIFDRNYGIFIDGAPICKLLDEIQPDVVEASSPWRPAWIVGNWQGDALKIFFAHNDNIGAYPQRWLDGIANRDQVEAMFDWYTQYMNRFLEKYDAFVTNGATLARRFRRRGMHVDASMPLGIDKGYFSPDLRDEKLRAAILAQIGLPPEGHLLLGMGRHHREKRWSVVIDAVEAAGSDLPVGMIMLGDGVDRQRLEKRIAGSPHIRMFRPIYDRFRLSQIMASCDALIHGADSEPFGLVGTEALASGLPLIVPDRGGCSDIAEVQFAETYTAGNAQAAAEAIRRMFAREPAILRAASRAASQRVRSDRDHAIALMDYYAEKLEERRRGGSVRLRVA